MRFPDRFKPSPAMVVACLALFIALGGVSYGVATGSIDGREIKNNSVASKDLRNNSATTADIKNGSLLRGDFRSGQLPAGPAGARGPDGPPGPAGRDGFGVVSYDISEDEPVTADGSNSAVAFCTPGTVPVGGATRVYDLNDTPTNFGDDTLVEGEEALVSSDTPTADPSGNPNGWSGSAWNNSTQTDRVVSVMVVCANADTVLAKRKQQGIARGR